MTIFNLVIAGFESDPSISCPLLFCVADAGIESTPFEREGRAMVTREAGVGAVMAVKNACLASKEMVIHQLICHRFDNVSQIDCRNLYMGRRGRENIGVHIDSHFSFPD